MPNKEECKKFIKTIAPIIVENYKICSILPSIRIAQLIEESGFGTSELAIKAKNFCGVKYNSYPTKKFYLYKNVKWSVFDSVEECIKQQGLYYNSKLHYYGKVVGEKNLEIALQELEKSPYCADKGYDKRLLKIIQSNDLTKYDDQVLNTSDRVIIDKKKFEKVQRFAKIDNVWLEPTQNLINKYGKMLIIKMCNILYQNKTNHYLLAIQELKKHIEIYDLQLWIDFFDVKPKHIKALIEKIADTL